MRNRGQEILRLHESPDRRLRPNMHARRREVYVKDRVNGRPRGLAAPVGTLSFSSSPLRVGRSRATARAWGRGPLARTVHWNKASTSGASHAPVAGSKSFMFVPSSQIAQLRPAFSHSLRI